MPKPGLWKLAPEVVIKPWGLVHTDALLFTGVTIGVGEVWLASAQTGPGNYSNTVVEPTLRRTLAELLREAASESDAALADLIGRGALNHLRAKPHRGKTEAWHVRAAEGETGFAAGPRTAAQAAKLRELVETEGLRPVVNSWPEEVRALFGIISPLHGGEVFVVPAGTLHTMFAIGPESRLVIDEIQQGYGEALLPTLSKILMVQNDLLSVQVHPDDRTVADYVAGRFKSDQDLQANPTVRVYDFGRRPGERPELGFRIVNPDAGLRRAQPVRVQAERGHSVEVLVAFGDLLKSRITLVEDNVYGLGAAFGSYRVLHCLDGVCEFRTSGRAMSVHRSDTVFVPACLEEELRIAAQTECSFFDHAFPSVPVLTRFLGTHGAAADQIEGLLRPPRAVPNSDR